MAPPSSLHRIAHAVAWRVDHAINGLSRRLRAKDPASRVRVLAYAGYRNAQEIRLAGRIVRYAEPLAPGTGFLSRVRAMLAIYNSHEVPGVTVRCTLAGRTVYVVSDGEGYFHFAIPVRDALPLTTRWESATLSTPGRAAQAESFTVPILAPGTDDHWAVISDIDDTVIETGATNFLKNWRRVLVDRPQDRLAVPGAASLYGLIAGDHAAPTRPFFYVSSSPWNLYGFLTEFMERNRIPHGPMFLRDIGIDRKTFIHAGHASHKLAAIETILAFYPGHRFVLVGDNGQEDVAIYAQAVADFPGRVSAVLIRDVSGACTTGANADRLAAIGRAGVLTYCAAGFEDAAAKLAELGFERPEEAATAAATA